MLDSLREVLHVVAGVLVWPVLLGLLGLAAAMLVALGSFLRDAWERRRQRRPRLAFARGLLDAVGADAHGTDLDIGIEEALQAVERRWRRSTSRIRLAVRVGPSLGLMGTLIPMADALQGLATGNLPALAGNMVTAFAATVIGLTISVTAYLIAAVRDEWVTADLADLAFHAERLVHERRPVGADRRVS